MRLSHTRSRGTEHNYWPSFVDVMTSLMLVLIFLLSIFMVAQLFLSQEIQSKDTILNRLNSEINELTKLLSLESDNKKRLTKELNLLNVSLLDSETERKQLQALVKAHTSQKAATQKNIIKLQTSLKSEKKISTAFLKKIEMLNQQIFALRSQLSALASILEAVEKKDREKNVKIADLGQRLNIALAQKIQLLAHYRSDFFGKLRDILGTRSDIRILGDRFVFQSEVLFDTGSDQLNSAGQLEIDKIAKALLDLEKEISSEIKWILRVDGHTDERPIRSERFPSNWELSVARALSVVHHLIIGGVSPKRLVAAGFGQYQPLTNETDEESLRKNRRIELKLTE
ncbi:MAG: peptidoglycan -binding protein [Alphaproteobacteria bacterium]|nr:peptidoglycan -binding protein [Alphaproteobacteria bacterium]